MRREVSDLRQQVDTQVVIIQPDVDMHATNHQTAHHRLQVIGQRPITFLRGGVLRARGGKRMGGRRDHRQPMVARDLRYRFSQMSQIVACLGDRATYSGADLDL